MNKLPGTPVGDNSDTLLKGCGILFILCASAMSIYIRCPSSAQYFAVYELTGVGLALLLSKSAQNASLKFRKQNIAVTLGGGVALPFILFFTNPIGSFKADSCLFNDSTALRVIVQGKEGQQDIPLRQQGSVVMEIIGKDNKESPIDVDGHAFFQNLRVGDSVRLGIRFSEPYEPLRRDSIYVIQPARNITLKIGLKDIGHVFGTVNYIGAPLAGVAVTLVCRDTFMRVVTQANGDFEFNVAEPFQQQHYTLWFYKAGFERESTPAYPEMGEPVIFPMTKKK